LLPSAAICKAALPFFVFGTTAFNIEKMGLYGAYGSLYDESNKDKLELVINKVVKANKRLPEREQEEVIIRRNPKRVKRED